MLEDLPYRLLLGVVLDGGDVELCVQQQFQSRAKRIRAPLIPQPGECLPGVALARRPGSSDHETFRAQVPVQVLPAWKPSSHIVGDGPSLRCVAEPAEDSRGPSILRPRREDLGQHAGARAVRVLVEREVDFGHRRPHQVEERTDEIPVPDHFQVGQMKGGAGPPGHVHHLVNSLEDAGCLIPDVHCERGPESGRLLGQFNELFGLSEHPRCVYETEGERTGPCLQTSPDLVPDRPELPPGGPAGSSSYHPVPHRVMPYRWDQPGCGPGHVQGLQILLNRGPRPAIGARPLDGPQVVTPVLRPGGIDRRRGQPIRVDEFGGEPLRDLGQEPGVEEGLEGAMRVQVDEARAQHQPVPSDDLSSMLGGQIGANRGDPCTGHGHVRHQPGAVSREHPRAANQQVKARHGRLEPTPSTSPWRPAWRRGDVRDGAGHPGTRLLG